MTNTITRKFAALTTFAVAVAAGSVHAADSKDEEPPPQLEVVKPGAMPALPPALFQVVLDMPLKLGPDEGVFQLAGFTSNAGTSAPTTKELESALD